MRSEDDCGILKAMSQVTLLLSQIEAGDETAGERLLPLVYEELRRMAREKLRQESPGQTLQPTALVHEAYLRLACSNGDADEPKWNSRGHFFAAAAEAMRRILVESARRKARLKRGGDLQRVEFDEKLVIAPVADVDLVALDEALTRLTEVDAQAAELVKLRYFIGLSHAEAAEQLQMAPRSADRLWAYAKAWLYREIGETDTSRNSGERKASAP
jgi:RNA polymerase sigma factor (TIGR02999 family)